MANEILDSPDVIHERFGEGECLLWQDFNLYGAPDSPLKDEPEAKEHGHPD